MLVDVPMDIFSKEIDVALFERLRLNTKTLHKPTIDEETAAEIVRKLVTAQASAALRGRRHHPRGRAATELRDFVDHLQIPVAHTLMGKGALPDDHPFILGMTGFWGTQVHQRAMPRRRPSSSASARASRKPTAARGSRVHVQLPADQADPHRHRSRGDRPQLPGRDRRRGRLQAGARRAQPRRAPDRCRKASSGRKSQGAIEAFRATFVAGNRGFAKSDAYPMRPERILADVRDGPAAATRIITTDVGWNKNGVGQQFPIYTPGTIFTPGRLRDDGFRRTGGAWAPSSRCPKRMVDRAGRRRRLRPEPGAARDGVRGRHRGHLGDHEQLRVRHDRGPREGALRNDVRNRVREGRQAVFARLRGDRAGRTAWTASRSNAAAEFKPALERAIKSKQALRHRRRDAERAGPTAGHWNIMDIYSPGKKVHHASVSAVAAK